MGRSYWFECSRCGYRAAVSGRQDRGHDFFVQTIQCKDCKALYDAVIKVRIADDSSDRFLSKSLHIPRQRKSAAVSVSPPSFERALSKLPYRGVRRFRWVRYAEQCPNSSVHRVQSWNDPGKCPKCGVYMERGALPYRIWE